MNQLPSNAEKQASVPSPDRRMRHGLIEDWRDALGILLLLFVAASLGAVLSRFWPDSEVDGQPPMAELDTRLSTLEARVANITQASDVTEATKKIEILEGRLAGLEAQFASVGTSPAPQIEGATPTATPPPALTLLSTARRLDDALARLSDLETRTSNLPSEMDTTSKALETLSATMTGLSTRLDDMAVRVGKIEDADILELAKQAALAAAIGNLARATQGSAPFKAELDIIVNLLPDDAALRALAPDARKGLPTTGDLMARFGKTAADALTAERKGQQTDSVSKLWTGFSGLVTWRSTSGQSGSATERRLARAETHLRSGDLEAAVRELNGITGAASKQLQPWLRDAQARLKIETVLARLNTQAIEAMTLAHEPEPMPTTEPPSR